MTNALLITVIGMGLVFAAILLLWGMMALLVRVTARFEAPPLVEAMPAANTGTPTTADSDRSRRAAVAAAAVALALASQPVASAETGSLSPWQSAHRATELNRRQRQVNS